MNDTLTPLDRAERALLDSETRLQQVLDNTSAVVFAKDREGRYLFVNREFEKLAGRGVERILGHTDEEVFAPDVATRFRYNDLRVLHEKRAIEFEESGDFGGGSRTFLAAKFPLFDSSGVAYAVCGIATDITERKRLEEALSSAALAVSQSEGEALFRELARYLATILGVDAVFIATGDAADPGRMQVRAMQLDGRTVENFGYQLAGTPCETVMGQQFRFYPSRLCELFPGDKDFRDLGFESYAGQPLNDSSGRPLGLLAVVARRPLERPAFVESVLRIFAVRVIAELERVSAQAALRASQDSYREIFEASEDAIFIHDWDTGAIVDVNSQACSAYGYPREELLRARLGDLCSGVAPYTEDDGLRWLEQARRTGSARFEWHRRNRDGSLHWDEVRLKAARIGGKPRLLAFTREITERKAAEQALRASEEQYRTVFNASVDALVVWNSRFERVDVNPAYERMYGWSREEVIGRGFDFPVYSPDHAESRRDLLSRALAGETHHAEHDVVRKDGRRLRAEVQAIPFQHDGQPHVLVIARDITERKHAESERQALEAQLRQAQRMEAIGRLTGGIAHDFNNLLTSILGYVTLASEREAVLADARAAGQLAQARRSCERARDLIQQMLTFSRGRRGAVRTVALPPLVADALETVRPALPANLRLATDFPPGVPPVRLDPLQLEQVLVNLCLNARDAVADGGALQVAVRALHADGQVCAGCRGSVDGDFVELSVADDGHGMSPDVAERIFEPFFSTKADGKGTGMGLAMVHGIVHEHGGHVLLDTAPGRGARFRVLWPAAPDAALESTDGGRPAARGRARRPLLAGRVLVVDDEASVGEFMRELLETWGIEATFAAGPQAALGLVAAEAPGFDAVITDLTMPRMNGLELARALHALRDDLPVILYSGYGEGLAREELQAAGIRTLLPKPVDPAALEAALRSIPALNPSATPAA